MANNDNASLSIGDHVLNEVDCTKFLGIYIDKNLCWNTHVDHVCKKISSGIFLLRLMKDICSEEALKIVYYGVVQPHLSYGIIFWGSCAEIRLLRVFVLQKTAIRVICNLTHKTPCRKYFQNMKILTLPSLYIFETIIYCVSKCNLVQGYDVHSHNTRSNITYRTDSHRLQIFEKLPMQAGIKFLNKLPNELKVILPNLKFFKTKLKQYLVCNAFYSVGEFMGDNLC